MTGRPRDALVLSVVCGLLIACSVGSPSVPRTPNRAHRGTSVNSISTASVVAARPSSTVPVPTGPRAVIAMGSSGGEPWRLFVFSTENGTGLGLALSSGKAITGCCLRPLWSPMRAAAYWKSERMLVAFVSNDVARLEFRPIAVSGVVRGEIHTVSDRSLHIPRVAILHGLAPQGSDGYLVGIDPTGDKVWREPVGLPPVCRIDHRRCLGFLDTYRMPREGSA